MSALHLKANSRGSWANVCRFAPDQIERIKDGCRLITLASDHTVSFKVADDHGVTLHSLDARGPLVWADRST